MRFTERSPRATAFLFSLKDLMSSAGQKYFNRKGYTTAAISSWKMSLPAL